MSPKVSSIAARSSPPGSPPPSGLMISQKREWLACPPALLRTGPWISDGSWSSDGQDLLDGPVLPLGAGQRGVRLVDIGLVVLAVVDLHRRRVDVGLQRVVRVGQIRQFERHVDSSPQVVCDQARPGEHTHTPGGYRLTRGRAERPAPADPGGLARHLDGGGPEPRVDGEGPLRPARPRGGTARRGRPGSRTVSA